MKSVLISIRPKRFELIASGKQTIWVQKSHPKIETPFKCYIYCTNLAVNAGSGKVIGEFVCDNVGVLFDTAGNPENYMTDILPSILQQTVLSYDEFARYVGGRADKTSIFGWHISDLKIYDKPRELSEFGRGCDAERINETHCRDCKKLVSLDDCCEVMCKPLNRSPRSWMYVEELQ